MKLSESVSALREATDAAAGRVDPELTASAEQVIQRVEGRLHLSGSDTVIALAGATGSGKSSLFNALCGSKIAEPGLKRPTTDHTLAAYWGRGIPEELLEWLGVQRRHLVTNGPANLSGLLLMDLPDHDSTAEAHRIEVDRLVQMVDMMLWVVDPQKYADAALHDGYLRPLADYADNMVVVLNQVDRLDAEERRLAVRDLRRILDAEGLKRTKIVSVSALTGMGIEELRKTILAAVKNKTLAAQRLQVDVSHAATRLSEALDGFDPAATVSSRAVKKLNSSLADAAAIDAVADATLRSMRSRGSAATGWPVVAWLTKFRPDPMKRLHLEKSPHDPVEIPRTSLPQANGVQNARVDSALRDLAAEASRGLPMRWAEAVREATLAGRTDLPDEMDAAIASADYALERGHGWWTIVKILQWIVLLVAIVGGGWLLLDVVLAYLQMPITAKPMVGDWPLPTLLLLGGVVAGILVALISRIGVELNARAKQLYVRRLLTKRISAVSDAMVVSPVNSELERFAQAKRAAKIAKG